MTEKNIVAIIQARVASKRFPRKVLKKLNGKNLILWVLNRIKKCALGFRHELWTMWLIYQRLHLKDKLLEKPTSVCVTRLS